MSESTNKEANKTQQQAEKAPTPDILRRDNEEFKIVKKLPKRFPTRPNDIYITNRTDFKAQLEKCKHLLFERSLKKSQNNETSEIVLHAIGPAINRAVNLALNLKSEQDCTINCYTSTILLEDDLIPLVDHLEIVSQHRHISAVHIKITQP